MKLLSATLTFLAAIQGEGFSVIQSRPSSTTFTGTGMPKLVHRPASKLNANRDLTRMYEPAFDPPNQSSSQQKLNSGFWVALDHTKKWLSRTLSRATKENPHGRNEVSYDCELNQETAGAIAGIFR